MAETPLTPDAPKTVAAAGPPARADEFVGPPTVGQREQQKSELIESLRIGSTTRAKEEFAEKQRLASQKTAATTALVSRFRERDVTGGGRGQQIFTLGTSNLATAEQQVVGTTTGGTSRPNVGPELAQQTVRDIATLAQATGVQLAATAAGMGIKFDVYKDLQLDRQEKVFPLLNEAQQIFDDANRQLVGIQEMVDDVRGNRINPGQFFANIGDAGTFAASMAVAAGHLASALGGGPNVALGVINGAIARNIRAQEVNQAHDRAILQAEIQIFDRMRTMGVDRLNMANVYNALLNAQAQTVLDGITAATASAETRAQIGIVQAQLALQKDEFLVKIAGNIQSTTTVKKFALQSKAAASAQESLGDALAKAIQGSVGQPLAERENLIRQTQATGAKITPEQIRAIKLHEERTPEGGIATPFSNVSETQFRIPGELDVIKTRDPDTGIQNENIGNARFQALPDKGENSKEEIRNKLQAVINASSNWVEIIRLGASLQVIMGAEGLGGALAASPATETDPVGTITFVGAGGESQDLAELIVRMNRAVQLNAMAASGGKMEAIRGPGENAILALRAGLPTKAQTMVGLIANDNMLNLLTPGADIMQEAAAVDFASFTQ